MRRTLVALRFAATCVAATASLPASADYFLDASQKGELIRRGEITGQDGALYNVWIVPGYEGPWQAAGEGWSDAGRALSRYGDGDLYRDTWRHSRDTFRFSHREIIREFAFKGSGAAWRESFGAARGRVEKRVFGWWFAYPWALLEATGSSALRLGVGLPTGVVVGVGGVSVLPLVELGFPVLKAGYHGGVEGTVLPAVGMTWNTVVAPPLALLGEQPAAERADGFWMKRIEPATTDTRLIAARQALAAWRDRQLAGAQAQSVTRQEAALEQELRARREAFLRQVAAEQMAAHDAAQAQLLVILRAAVGEDGLPDAAALAALAQRHGREPLLQSLRGTVLDEPTARALLDALLGGQAAPATVAPDARPDAAKTDPLRRSLELMGE